MRRAASTGARTALPRRAEWRNKTWETKTTSGPPSASKPSRDVTQVPSAKPQSFQARAVAGHQSQRCSVPASPSPQSGQTPKADASGTKPVSPPLCRLRAAALSLRGAGMRSAGSNAHPSPLRQPPAHGLHQASPSSTPEARSSEGADQAMRTSSQPQPEQVLAMRSQSCLHLARLETPLQSILSIRTPSVTLCAHAISSHSEPGPGAHLLS